MNIMDYSRIRIFCIIYVQRSLRIDTKYYYCSTTSYVGRVDSVKQRSVVCPSVCLSSRYLPSSSKYKCNVYSMQLATVWEGAARYGLVAVGAQEQAEDILVPRTATKLFDFNDISFPSHYLPPRTMVLAIVFSVWATLKCL